MSERRRLQKGFHEQSQCKRESCAPRALMMLGWLSCDMIRISRPILRASTGSTKRLAHFLMANRFPVTVSSADTTIPYAPLPSCLWGCGGKRRGGVVAGDGQSRAADY